MSGYNLPTRTLVTGQLVLEVEFQLGHTLSLEEVLLSLQSITVRTESVPLFSDTVSAYIEAEELKALTVEDWEFFPATVNGEPVGTNGTEQLPLTIDEVQLEDQKDVDRAAVPDTYNDED